MGGGNRGEWESESNTKICNKRACFGGNNKVNVGNLTILVGILVKCTDNKTLEYFEVLIS